MVQFQTRNGIRKMKQLSTDFGSSVAARRALLAGLLLLPLVLADRGFALRSGPGPCSNTIGRRGTARTRACRPPASTPSRKRGTVISGWTPRRGWFVLRDRIQIAGFFQRCQSFGSTVTSLAGARTAASGWGWSTARSDFATDNPFPFAARRLAERWHECPLLAGKRRRDAVVRRRRICAARLTRSGAFEQLTTSGSPTNGALNAMCCLRGPPGPGLVRHRRTGALLLAGGKIDQGGRPGIGRGSYFLHRRRSRRTNLGRHRGWAVIALIPTFGQRRPSR